MRPPLEPTRRNLVDVWIADRTQAGSCNACQSREESDVTVVDLQSVTFRLCSWCRRSIVRQLASFERDK